jgi:hypothetical protein
MATALGGPPTNEESVMNAKKTALMAILGVVLAGTAAASASAESRWQADHPRRAEVNHRLHNQAVRIKAERRAGEISAAKAHRLRVADRHVLRQERRDAAMHGGHISRAEQHRLNREQNRISGRIG